MTHPVPTDLHPLAEQPTSVIIKISPEAGLFIKRTVVARADTVLPQHSHDTGHFSFIAAGKVRVWSEGEWIGDVTAPDGVFIRAHAKHLFATLADNTIIDCIHRTNADGEIGMTEEHHLPGISP